MNLDIIKNKIKSYMGKKVMVTVNGMRSRVNRYEGIIYKMYPNIFTLKMDNTEKSFAYRDVVTQDVKIKLIN